MEGPISKPRSSWPSARQQEHSSNRSAKLKKLLLRYYPPGIILEYEDHMGTFQQSSLDLLNLDVDTDVEVRASALPFAFASGFVLRKLERQVIMVHWCGFLLAPVWCL
jgi:hypothetical protein